MSLLKYYFQLIFTNLFFVSKHIWLYPNKTVQWTCALCGNTMHRAGAQSCLSPWNTIDCSLPGSSVYGIFQARILEWVDISFSRGSSSPKDWTLVSCVSCICRKLIYHWVTWETHVDHSLPDSSLHGILQTKILEQVDISFSRGSSPLRDWTRVSYVPCIGRLSIAFSN